MKVKEIEKSKKFQPFTFEVKIETEDELYDLYHRLNVSDEQVVKLAGGGINAIPVPDYDKEEIDDYLFGFIERKVEELQ